MSNFTRKLLENYNRLPDQVAVRLLHSDQPDSVLSYRQLLHTSATYTQALEDSGIEPTEVVILIMQHGTDLVCSFFGAILGGIVPSIMPFLTEKLQPEQYRKSLKALFEITAPAAVIAHPLYLDDVRQAASGTSVRAILSSQEITATYPHPDSLKPDNLQGVDQSPEAIALLQHSSGTTGLQKGVALSHQAIFNQLDSYSEAIQLNTTDVVVSWLPLYHDMGLIAGFILPILEQVPLVLLSPFDWVRAPHRLMQAISQYQGTLTWLPNFAYNFCAQKIRDRELQGVDLSSLRAVINCSEPMYLDSHEMFLERFKPYGFQSSALATSYAMAENVFAVTQGGIDAPVRIDPIDPRALLEQQVAKPLILEAPNKDSDTSVTYMLSAGKPIAGTQVRIVDSTGQDLLPRHIGEILVKSNCMLTGYYQRPDLTAKAFLDGWYTTGDLGYLADGQVYITGRKKDLIIVGGKNIYPQDLERLAGEVPHVHPGRVVAFGIFNKRSGTEDVVLIAEIDHLENDPSSDMDLFEIKRQEIASEIRKRVTTSTDVALRFVQVVPRNWLIKTSSGKIARSANRQKYLAEFDHPG